MKKIYRVLICVGACTAALLLPVTGADLLLAPIIALAGFMAAQWGAAYLMPVMLCGIVGFGWRGVELKDGVLRFTGGAGIWCLIAAFVLICLAAAYCMRRRVPNRYALLAYAAILCLGIYLAFCLDSILAGDPPYAATVSYLQKLDEDFEQVFGSTYTPAARANLGGIIAMIPDLLMMLSLLLAELMAMSVLVFGRVWYKAFGEEPVKMAEFHLWRLPKSILIGAGITAAACVLAFVFKLSIAPALAWTMGLAFVSLFSVQGLSYLMFIYHKARASQGIRVFTWVFAVLCMPYSLIFLSITGIVEQICNKRARISAFERMLELSEKQSERERDMTRYGYFREDIHPRGNDKDNDDKSGGDSASDNTKGD